MRRLFNQNFIDEFSEIDYIRCLQTINYLDLLRDNYNYRYDDSYDKFNGTINLFKESLDHYVLKRMENDLNFINLAECNNYFNYLRKLSNTNKYDFYTNVVLFNVLNNPKFLRYKEKYGLNNQMPQQKFGKAMIDINHIISKVRHNKILTHDELNLLCGFVSDYRENTEILNDVIKYIFNNLTTEDCKLKCSLQVISAIATYIPYKSDAIKKNGFDPATVRIMVANKYHYDEKQQVGKREKRYSGMGQSSGEYRQIILSGRVSKNTNFKSIDSSKNTFSFEEYFKTGDYSFTLMLLTLYHEITHQYQRYMSRRDVSKLLVDSDSYIAGLPMALCDVLDEEYHDYRDNHDNDDIEIHATKVGWEMCASFYKDILVDSDLKKELMTRSNRNKNGTQTRYAFSIKKDKNGNMFDAVKYTLDNCLRVMKNAGKRAKYFKEMPCLQYIFTDDGRFKIDILLIRNFGNTQIGAGLLEKLVNTPGIDNKISDLVKKYKNSKDILTIIAYNIYMGIRFSNNRLYMIEFYTRKDFDDSFQINNSFLEVADSILSEQNDTIKNGKRILHHALNCNDYDELIDKNRKSSLDYYRQILDNINKSKNLHKKGKK